MLIDQDTINAGISGLSILFGWVLKVLYSALQDLQNVDKELANKVQAMELLVAGKYVQKEEFERLSNALFVKLDKIDDKRDETHRLIAALFAKVDRLDDKVSKIDEKVDHSN